MLYKDKLTEWLKTQKIYLKYSTYTNYYNIIMNHIYPKLGDYDISMIDNDILQQFILEQLDNGRADNKGGISHKYVKDKLVLTSFPVHVLIKASPCPNAS